MSEIEKTNDLKRFMLDSHFGSSRVSWIGNKNMEQLSGPRQHESFRKEGLNYQLGEYAYIISKKDIENGFASPIVGRIEKLYQLNNKKLAKIIFFYRIQDIPDAKISDNRALFSSSLEREVELNEIQKKCIVVDSKEKLLKIPATPVDMYYIEGKYEPQQKVSRGPWSKKRRVVKQVKPEKDEEIVDIEDKEQPIVAAPIIILPDVEINTNVFVPELINTSVAPVAMEINVEGPPCIEMKETTFAMETNTVESPVSMETKENAVTLESIVVESLPCIEMKEIPVATETNAIQTSIVEESSRKPPENSIKVTKEEEISDDYIEVVEDYEDETQIKPVFCEENKVEKNCLVSSNLVCLETINICENDKIKREEKVADNENKETSSKDNSENKENSQENSKENSSQESSSENNSQENSQSGENNSKSENNSSENSKENSTVQKSSSVDTSSENSKETSQENPNVQKSSSTENSDVEKSPKSKKRSNSKKSKKSESQSPKKKKDSKKKRKKFSDDSEEEAPVKEEEIYKIGDYVWAKIKSFPWWPGRVSSPDNKNIDSKILEGRKKNTFLIYFFGSRDYSWVPANRLMNFMNNFKEKTRSVDDFDLGEAIEEAIDCSPDKEKLEDMLTDEDTACEVCKLKTDADNMLLCDNCDCGYHLGCLVPKLQAIPETNWYCPDCIKKGKTAINIDSTPVMNLKAGVSGLYNIGSTCYINSALQCLNAVTDFRKRVSNKGNLDNALITALEAVLKALWTEKGVTKSELETLKTCSGNALDFKYHTSEHQDINEFLIQLLEYIHVQFDKIYKQENPDSKLESSPVLDNFEGVLARTRTCPNGHSYTSREPFRVLPLQFTAQQAKNKKPIELKKMIDEFSKEESLECRCEKCGGSEDRVFKQVTEIEKFPKFLIIQLVRFVSGVENETWWSNKIKTEVLYPLYGLDLSNKSTTNTGEYDLLGVVNHKGEVRGGHYWAFVRDTDENDQDEMDYWYNFNDHNVKPLNNEEDVQSAEAYMLLYERKS